MENMEKCQRLCWRLPLTDEIRSRDTGVVNNSFWFLSVVHHLDQMTGSIINQLSILTRSYHIRDLLQSMSTLLLNYGDSWIMRYGKEHMVKGGRKYVDECLQVEDRAYTTYSGILTLCPIALILGCYENSDWSLELILDMLSDEDPEVFPSGQRIFKGRLNSSQRHWLHVLSYPIVWGFQEACEFFTTSQGIWIQIHESDRQALVAFEFVFLFLDVHILALTSKWHVTWTDSVNCSAKCKRLLQQNG
jgi:hypothetical protein